MYLLFILFLNGFLHSTEQTDFADLEIVSDLLPADCYAQNLDYTLADTKDGLPKCVRFKNTLTQCAKFHYSRALLYAAINKPTCRKDGAFAAKQCKGERRTGRCFCYDPLGVRVFGQNWWKDADDMTCACSSKKTEMRAEDNPLYFNSLHCNSVGNFEPLQCDVVSNQCWCVEEKTGELTSPVVPYSVLSKLPCYSVVTSGIQYLRQCESQMYAQQRILHEFSLHGTTGASFGTLLCDDDGSYGAYSVRDGSAYCTWRDNTSLGPYQYIGNRTLLDCNCARDKKIYSKAGKTLNQECNGSGNYELFQTLTDPPYCLDKDGFKKTPSDANPKNVADCGSYPAY